MPLFPHEANTVLLRDANAVLTCPVAFQFLKIIAGQDLQILELDSGVENHELAACAAQQTRRQDNAFRALVDGFALRGCPGLYHRAEYVNGLYLRQAYIVRDNRHAR